MSPKQKASDAAPGKPFIFCQISHPDEQNSSTWKRKVRSHAAKNPQARRLARSSNGYLYNGTQVLRALEPRHAMLASRSGPSAGPFWAPGPVTLLDAGDRDPFNVSKVNSSSFEKELCKIFIEENVLSRIGQAPGMGLDISPAKAKRFWTAVSQHWIRQANTDIGMFASVCLFSCRHIYLKMGATHPEILETHAEMYKIALRENLTRCMAVNMRDKNIPDDTITKMMALISDDTLLGNMEQALQDMESAADLVNLRVGWVDDTQRPERDRTLGGLEIVFSNTSDAEGALGGVVFGSDGQPSTRKSASKSRQKQLVFHVGRQG
ncbi:hypothetical protein GQ607_012367 [Colletotrichum asianum]|uniref:Uncharacterized protein n=1 Tax=Colletotrichum asianum TaxID=702518 RepID=A0A8H3ZNP0_9PEZI|nr:hypothetical protein GQ607_012367 [Colletotrichum asianum]